MNREISASRADATLPAGFGRNISILCCPASGGELELTPPALCCRQCRHGFKHDNGTALLFWPNEGQSHNGDVTEIVRAFYAENPFPNYAVRRHPLAPGPRSGRKCFSGAISEP